MVTIHPRSSWVEAAYPVTGPTATPSKWQAVVYHYPGGNVRSATLAETISIVRRMQRDYRTTRKYSLGYCYVVGTGGDVLEVRGLDLRNAANDGTDALTGMANYNDVTVSIQFATAGDAPATEAQLVAAVDLHRMIETRCGRKLRVEGHGDKDATPCPGAGIRAQLPDLERRIHRPAPAPIPDVPDEEDDVRKILVRSTISGGMYCTDLLTYAHFCTETEGEALRDRRGAEVAGDSGPFPLDAIESAYVERMAAKT